MLEEPCPHCEYLLDVNQDVCPNCGMRRRRVRRRAWLGLPRWFLLLLCASCGAALGLAAAPASGIPDASVLFGLVLGLALGHYLLPRSV